MYGNNPPFIMPGYNNMQPIDYNIINELITNIDNLQKQVSKLEEITNKLEKINITKKYKDDDVYII